MTTASAPPDWSTQPAELACPLCHYNLRGLTDPRCPECGFAFTWAELLDERRDRHPWLFEHAPRGRRLRAFRSTYWRSALPRRFWRDVTPANPVRRWRLVGYWVATAVLLLGVIVGPLAVQAGRVAVLIRNERALLRPVPGQPGLYARPGRFGTATAAQVDTVYPPVLSRRFALTVADLYLQQTGGAFVAVAVVTAAWPWLTVAALMVFQTSMRRAKTDVGHVVRTAVYGCDVSLLVTVAAVGLYAAADAGPVGRVRGSQVVDLAATLAVPTALLCAAVATYRVSVAYRRYLRFHLPLATVLASQVIAFLFVLAVAVTVAEWG